MFNSPHLFKPINICTIAGIDGTMNSTSDVAMRLRYRDLDFFLWFCILYFRRTQLYSVLLNKGSKGLRYFYSMETRSISLVRKRRGPAVQKNFVISRWALDIAPYSFCAQYQTRIVTTPSVTRRRRHWKCFCAEQTDPNRTLELRGLRWNLEISVAYVNISYPVLGRFW